MIYIKKYIFGVISLLVLFIFIVIPKDKKELSYQYLEEAPKITVYYVDDNKLIGVLLPYESENKYDLIKETFNYLTEKANSTAYQSMINLSTKLVSYEVRNKTLYLNLSDDFFRTNLENTTLAIGQIFYTFKELGYVDIYLLNNNEIIRQIGDCFLEEGIKSNLLVNFEVVSKTLETKTIRIEYVYQNNNKTFMNYIIDLEEDEIKFKLERLISFVNKEYEGNLKLLSFEKNVNELIVLLDGEKNLVDTLEKQLLKNFNCNVIVVEK